MKYLTKGLYNCPNSSINVRVLKVYYQDEKRVTAKLSFEYRSGLVIEIKNYKMKLKNLQHWEPLK